MTGGGAATVVRAARGHVQRARGIVVAGPPHDDAAETRERLARLAQALSGQADWSDQALEAALRAFAESEGVGLGKIGPALRAVLSGGSPAPDLAGALVSLGKAESLGRIEDALSSRA